MIFHTEKRYYSCVVKIQIWLISDENMRHFTCDLVLLLGETPLGKHIASIFAQNRTITYKGSSLHRVRKEPLSLVLARPCISLSFIGASSQATIVSPFKWNMLRHFHRRDEIVARALTSLCDCTFRLRSSIVAATKTACAQ
jgi:hypothetical protein